MRFVDFRLWHIASVTAMQRHVGSWGQTGVRRETGKE